MNAIASRAPCRLFAMASSHGMKVRGRNRYSALARRRPQRPWAHGRPDGQIRQIRVVFAQQRDVLVGQLGEGHLSRDDRARPPGRPVTDTGVEQIGLPVAGVADAASPGVEPAQQGRAVLPDREVQGRRGGFGCRCLVDSRQLREPGHRGAELFQIGRVWPGGHAGQRSVGHEFLSMGSEGESMGGAATTAWVTPSDVASSDVARSVRRPPRLR